VEEDEAGTTTVEEAVEAVAGAITALATTIAKS
jgi:hypothetical protein